MKKPINGSTLILLFITLLAPVMMLAQPVIKKENLVNASIDVNGKLIITPSKSSSQHDFDFFEGRWTIHNKKLKARLSGSTEWLEYDGVNDNKKILRGIGHTNNNRSVMDGKPYE